MAPVAPVIAAALVSAGASATVAAIGAGIATTLLTSALSFGITALFAKKPKIKQSDIPQDFQQTAGGYRFHYGRGLVGAAARIFYGHDGAGTLYKLAVIASDGISSVNNHWLDGEPVSVDEFDMVTNEKYQSKIGSHVKLISTLGADDQAALSDLVAAFPSEWTSDHRARGHALMYAECFYAKGSQLSSMYPKADAPDFAMDINGREVLDPRDDTTAFTENPALQLYDYLQTAHGGGFAPSEFAEDEVEDAADDNDDSIVLKSGGTEARYRCSLTVDETDDRSVYIAQFLGAMAGSLRTRPDGLIGLRSGKWRTPTVTIEEQDIISIGSSDADDSRTSYSKRVSTFIDPTARFTETTTSPMVNSTLLARIGDTTEKGDRLQVPSGTQCARLDKIATAFDNPERKATLVLKFIGLRLIDEENCHLNIPDRGYTNAPMWVDSWSTEDFINFTVTLKTAEPTSFDWDAATEEPEQPLSLTLPGQTGGVAAMSGLAVVVTRGTINGQDVPRIVATWDSDDRYGAVCQISTAGDDEWENMNVQASGNRAAINILDESVDYDLRVFWSVDPTRTTEPGRGTGVEEQEDDIEVIANNTPPGAPVVDSAATNGSFVHTVHFSPDAGANYEKTIARQTGTTINLAVDYALGGDNALAFYLNDDTNTYEIVSLNPSGLESTPTSLGSLTGPPSP